MGARSKNDVTAVWDAYAQVTAKAEARFARSMGAALGVANLDQTLASLRDALDNYGVACDEEQLAPVLVGALLVLDHIGVLFQMHEQGAVGWGMEVDESHFLFALERATEVVAMLSLVRPRPL